MIWLLIPRWLKRAVAWLLAGLAAVWGIIAATKRSDRQKAKLEAAAEYQRTIKEMGRVEIVDDHDAAQRWLRERGQR